MGTESMKTDQTHVVAKNDAICVNISVSLLDVSSKPGVSISVTHWPSSSKGEATWTVLVQDWRLLPTGKLDPLTRLTNYAIL